MKLNSQYQAVLLILLGVVGVLLLLASWAGLYLLLLAWTEGALAPWDTIHTNEPPLGTLPRTLNDFFEWRGSHVPSVLVVFGGVCAVAFRFIRQENRVAVLWRALLTNLLFLPALFPVYWLGLALDGLWSALTNRVLLEPRFSFGHFAAACGLWLGYIAVQGSGFSFLQRIKATSDE